MCRKHGLRVKNGSVTNEEKKKNVIKKAINEKNNRPINKFFFNVSGVCLLANEIGAEKTKKKKQNTKH